MADGKAFAQQIDAWLSSQGLNIDAADIDGKPATYEAAFAGISEMVERFSDPSAPPEPLRKHNPLKDGGWGGVYAARSVCL